MTSTQTSGQGSAYDRGDAATSHLNKAFDRGWVKGASASILVTRGSGTT